MGNNMRKINVNDPDASFFEIYGYWAKYGEGLMLVYRAPRVCEYVVFTNFHTRERTVINDELLDNYLKGD